jgi:predicted DsbA family dithiol-disulfide isomerase
MTPRAIVFSDPNCPFCYATEERLHALDLDGHVEWRGVQHAPHLAVPMAPADRVLARELPTEVSAIRTRAPEVEIAVPPGKPNTELAIRYGAAALRADPIAGRRFVRSLYRAFWREGRDLSDPGVLDALAAEAGLAGFEPDREATDIAKGWERTWQNTGLRGVPLMLRADGEVLYGLVEREVLRDFVDRPAVINQERESKTTPRSSV